MRTRLWPCIATVVALVSGAAIGAFADETDNFTCRSHLTRDSGGALDAWMNGKIQEALARANRRGAGACNSECLFQELQKAIGGSCPEPLTLIPHARFEQWIRKQRTVDRCHLKFRDTIYGVHAYNQPWLLPFHRRIIFVADSIRLFGHVVGIDKVGHFIREGLDHWREVRNGREIASVMKEELGPPGWQLRWNEHGLKGLSLTGVIAYADLAAGYSGFRFWADLLSIGRPVSFVTYDAPSGKYVQTQPFTFALYVSDAWDEAVNYSALDAALGREVAAGLGRRSLTRPITDCRLLASLPDARLYVNPACLPVEVSEIARSSSTNPDVARIDEVGVSSRIQHVLGLLAAHAGVCHANRRCWSAARPGARCGRRADNRVAFLGTGGDPRRISRAS